MSSVNRNRQIGWAAAFTLLAWLGEYVHNRFELPQLTILSPENSLPALIFLVLFTGWWLLPYRWVLAILMMAWALLHLVGGAIVTVIPFSFLPFYPRQSVGHYVVHVVYGLAQVPLLGLMYGHVRRDGGSAGGT